jgi:hypothetical protein
MVQIYLTIVGYVFITVSVAVFLMRKHDDLFNLFLNHKPTAPFYVLLQSFIIYPPVCYIIHTILLLIFHIDVRKHYIH